MVARRVHVNGKGCLTALGLMIGAILLVGICGLWIVRNEPPANPESVDARAEMIDAVRYYRTILLQ